MNPVNIYIHKNNPDAIIPQVAYGNTSACFDITCVETTIIHARSSAVVPNGLNISIDQSEPYWMQIQLRSSKGFKYELIPHYGTVDCVPAGTKIFTPYGEKNVEDLYNSNDVKDKFVLSFNENSMEMETDEIEEIWIEKNKELYLLETEDGDIIELPLTKEVYTKRGWIKIQDLKENDYILKII